MNRVDQIVSEFECALDSVELSKELAEKLIYSLGLSSRRVYDHSGGSTTIVMTPQEIQRLSQLMHLWSGKLCIIYEVMVRFIDAAKNMSTCIDPKYNLPSSFDGVLTELEKSV